MIVVRWIHNAIVTVASTCSSVQPLVSVKRYSGLEKRVLTVQCPQVITAHNKNMGGIDRMDENMSLYRIGIRGNKWCWCIFTWMVDTCVNNTRRLHKNAGGTMSQLDFKRSIALTLLKSYGTTPKSPGRLGQRRLPDSVRF